MQMQKDTFQIIRIGFAVPLGMSTLAHSVLGHQSAANRSNNTTKLRRLIGAQHNNRSFRSNEIRRKK